MTTSNLTDLSIEILLQYYENNLEPFFTYCHENILWIGHANNQIIRSKDHLLEAFSNEENPLFLTILLNVVRDSHPLPNV